MISSQTIIKTDVTLHHNANGVAYTEKAVFTVGKCEYQNGTAYRVACVGGFLADGEDYLEYRSLHLALVEHESQIRRALEIR